MHGNDVYTEEIGNEIIDLYVNGNTVQQICLAMDMNFALLWDWLQRIKPFADKFYAARPAFSTYIAEDTLAISDNERDPQRARMQIQARQWLAGKYAPEVYGDAVQVKIEHSVDLTLALQQAQARIDGHIAIIEHDDDDILS